MKLIKKLLCIVLTAVIALSSAVSAGAEYYYYYGELDEFSTEIRPYVWAWMDGSSVVINAEYIQNADGYKFYRYNPETRKYKQIGKSAANSCSFVDTDIDSFTTYKYMVKAYQKNGSKTLHTKSSEIQEIEIGLLPPDVTVKMTNSKINISIAEDANVEGYEIYTCKHDKCDSLSDYIVSDFWGTSFNHPEHTGECMKKAGTLKDKNACAIKRSSDCDYYIQVRAYTKVDGEKVYSSSKLYSTIQPEVYINSTSNKAKDTIKIVTYRDDYNGWTITLSDEDKKILKAFAKQHFTDDMSKYEKLEYVAQYIHYNVDYAYDYTEIYNMSYVEAIFKAHKGQCLQYNGAMAAMAAYLGCNVRIIQGKRGTGEYNSWSHYWCEINVNGYYYLLDAGNKKDGLYYFIEPYESAYGYLRFDQPIYSTKKTK